MNFVQFIVCYFVILILKIIFQTYPAGAGPPKWPDMRCLATSVRPSFVHPLSVRVVNRVQLVDNT